MRKFVPFILILVTALTACGGGLLPTGEPVPTDEQGGIQETPAEVNNILPPEPQEVVFQASDGQELTGIYYPAAVNPAPVVVFMHWVGGDKSDWYEIAPWLQNRSMDNPFENPGAEAWWDPTWFPAVPVGASYGVFIFSFRGCTPFDAGCATFVPELWLLDAQAAIQTAAGLDGVDPTKVVAIGSSIGADGAPDACLWLNEQTPGSCKGALSLSPGSYLGPMYPDVVQALGASTPPTAVWCLADENEIGMCETAADSGNTAYQTFMITGGSHGNRMLRPDLDPLPMQLILNFLTETVGP